MKKTDKEEKPKKKIRKPKQSNLNDKRFGKPALGRIPKSQKELTVRISVKHSYIELVGGIVEGSSEDVFSGAFTEDGKTWNVTWTSFPKYIARTEDKAEINLSKNVTEEGVTTSLVFEKEVKK